MTGQILERAGLENVTGLLVNFLKLRLGTAFLGFSGNGVGGILNCFAGGQHGVGGVGDFVSRGVQFLKRRGE